MRTTHAERDAQDQYFLSKITTIGNGVTCGFMGETYKELWMCEIQTQWIQEVVQASIGKLCTAGRH